MSRVRRGEVWWIHMGPPCSTFSMARLPRLRTTRFPWEVPGLKPDKKLLVRAGTLMCLVALEIAALCLKHNVAFTWENPHSSMMWNFPPVSAFMKDPRTTSFVITYCGYGTSWKKPTRLLTNCPELQAAVPHCVGCGGMCSFTGEPHQALRGQGPSGELWTKVACPYPLPMCKEIALALRQRAPLVRTTNALFGTPSRAEKSPAPALDPAWLEPGRWSPSFREEWQRLEHNNVLEAWGVLAVLRHVARTSRAWSSRVLVFTDSMVTLGCLSKGRSSATALLRVCRAAAAIQLVCRIRTYLRWVPSEKYLADYLEVARWASRRRPLLLTGIRASGSACRSGSLSSSEGNCASREVRGPFTGDCTGTTSVPSLSAGDARTKAAAAQERCARVGEREARDARLQQQAHRARRRRQHQRDVRGPRPAFPDRCKAISDAHGYGR